MRHNGLCLFLFRCWLLLCHRFNGILWKCIFCVNITGTHTHAGASINTRTTLPVIFTKKKKTQQRNSSSACTHTHTHSLAGTYDFSCVQSHLSRTKHCFIDSGYLTSLLSWVICSTDTQIESSVLLEWQKRARGISRISQFFLFCHSHSTEVGREGEKEPKKLGNKPLSSLWFYECFLLCVWFSNAER